MRSGDLKHRVKLQRYSITNTSGQAVPTYSDVGTYWAKVEPLSGREQLIAVQQNAMNTHKVTMRNVTSINCKDRFIYKTRTLEITSVVNVGEIGAELNLICIEVV